MNLIKSAFFGIGRIISAYWHSHTTKGQIWLACAIIALIVDAKLCYEYGVTQTTWHGIGFAVVALFFSQLPDGAYDELKKGNKVSAAVLGILCIPLGAVAYQSHIGYGAGVRMGDIKKASIQNAKYDDARDQVTDNRANLEMWKKQLADLTKDNPWLTSITAEALRAKLPGLNLAIEQEAARGGCGPNCLKFTKDRDDVNAQIANIEKKDKLTAQIEATQRLVDKYRAASAQTEAGMSSVAMQTTANTQLFGLVRAAWTGEPLEQALKTTEESAKLANLVITALGSLAFMLMAPIGFFMAGRNRQSEDAKRTVEAALHTSTAQMQQTASAFPRSNTSQALDALASMKAQPKASLPALSPREIVRDDRAVWADLNRLLNGPAQIAR